MEREWPFLNLWNKRMKKQIHTIDATNKPLGRLAVQVSELLRGRQRPDYVPYLDMGDEVVVTNIKQIRITGQKLTQKMYRHHSGYLGGLKEKTLGKMMQETPGEALRKAVMGMLPKNKLRNQQIKRLRFE
ncbi:MAG: 50S ribosomal protein L13 [Candidatus Wildermuthbacteria bacterium RIFCSPHIGHO2_01_FULL_45_20]|uniref:Large ribosomal subunit protein uL13 n=1 Tax=Candidatus Wildermuthbacteria bacterium RIFCSPHIGHO2_02_FULL_45_25 TaxID=1802450 RepID=A0A1G2QXG9_9BACT|nr:MAG: 50S ribosomal protein L13 [Candidatus Wildermuthbacteria bacterium RIFCSPHIGHO2_01_FULL_45_20]OHA65276.1 MAG: 50S ribosomal protein L13 [Candidatus Wildermuthbacteria bacterium RIFCSPHIGHO2_02_FULL_45_25]